MGIIATTATLILVYQNKQKYILAFSVFFQQLSKNTNELSFGLNEVKSLHTETVIRMYIY